MRYHFTDNRNTAARQSDIIARYGVEKFIVFMPTTNREESIKTKEKYRMLIRETSMVGLSITASIGVSTVCFSCPLHDKEISQELLVEQADKSLYKAKEKGRDLVWHF